jgi:hypothetical protein
MANQSVIIEFQTVEERDLWASKLREGLRRVFSSDPWLAGDFSADQLRTVTEESNARISPDVRMQPMGGKRGLGGLFRSRR